MATRMRWAGAVLAALGLGACKTASQVAMGGVMPDGESIAFLAEESDIKPDMFLELWVMSADGTGLREIVLEEGLEEETRDSQKSDRR